MLDLLSGVNRLIVAKGRKITAIDLQKDRPADDELVKLMTGPTGNLRAPTLRRGKKLLIGFQEEMYGDAL